MDRAQEAPPLNPWESGFRTDGQRVGDVTTWPGSGLIIQNPPTPRHNKVFNEIRSEIPSAPIPGLTGTSTWPGGGRLYPPCPAGDTLFFWLKTQLQGRANAPDPTLYPETAWLLSGPSSPGSQAHKWDRSQSETARPINTRDNQMAIGKFKNICNRNPCHLEPSETSSPTTASPGYPNTPENQDDNLKSHPMKMIEDLKEK